MAAPPALVGGISAKSNGSSVVKGVVLCAGEGLGGACRAVRSSSGSKLGEVTRVGDGSDPLGVGVRASVAGLNPTPHDTSSAMHDLPPAVSPSPMLPCSCAHGLDPTPPPATKPPLASASPPALRATTSTGPPPAPAASASPRGQASSLPLINMTEMRHGGVRGAAPPTSSDWSLQLALPCRSRSNRLW